MRHDELVGRKVAGRFTIKRFLGEGGMATVYVAEQDAEPRDVALKIMNADLNADRSFVRRFQREAKAASRVQHPNSVQIIDYGVTDEGLSYIAMELLVGDDLYLLLERSGALAQRRAVRILAEICDVLMVAHELGIVHRDLKPENIMVLADPSHPDGERVKVLDFGIAKLLVADSLDEPSDDGSAPEPASAVTRAGTFIGTPAYMSPEQCGLLPVDTRADLYTCGVLLFQLVTGRMPFEGETPLHTAMLHIHQQPPAPSSFAPKIDPRLEALILKALSKKPADRHQTARHLGLTLRKLAPDLVDVPVAAGPLSKRATASFGAPSGGPPPLLPVISGLPGPATPLDLARTLVAENAALGPAPAVLFQSDAPPSSEGPVARIRPAAGAPPLETLPLSEEVPTLPRPFGPQAPAQRPAVDPLARTAFDHEHLPLPAALPRLGERTLESDPGDHLSPQPPQRASAPSEPLVRLPTADQSEVTALPQRAPATLAPQPAGSGLGGLRGLLIGFLAGVLVMTIFALVYLFVLQK